MECQGQVCAQEAQPKLPNELRGYTGAPGGEVGAIASGDLRRRKLWGVKAHPEEEAGLARHLGGILPRAAEGSAVLLTADRAAQATRALEATQNDVRDARGIGAASN